MADLTAMMQAAAGNAGDDANFIEDMFSCFLYTGTSAARDIVNGIDLAGEGGLVWIKCRTIAESNSLFTTDLGANKTLLSNSPAAQDTVGTSVFQSFNSDGFRVGTHGRTNESPRTYASWTFRKAPKFFDVVTYTGNGANRTVAHNLESAPGCVIVKCTSTTGQWATWHRSGTQLNNFNAYLNTTQGYADAGAGIWGANGGVPSMTSTTFSLGTDSDVNTSGETYVAYLFAHDAGGFGLTGTENVISCGSYTCVASPGNVTVTLGYEPQWVMVKNATQASNWVIYDTMRGMPATSPPNPVTLAPDSAAAENGVTGSAPGISPTATGFIARAGLTAVSGSPGDTVIYIAIRRGPMKVPETGTSVFAPVAYAGDSSATRLVNAGINIDANISAKRSGPDFFVQSRLTGVAYLRTRAVNGENSSGGTNGIPTILTSENNTFGFIAGASTLSNVNETGSNYVDWAFTRAPTFLDVVCYTGTGANRTVTHNLNAAPELMLVKQRNGSEVWSVYYGDNTDFLVLNSNQATTDSNIYWNDTSPTSSVFTLGTGNEVNGSGSTYVAYLFASCAGVSKVGSYTGTGTTQTINCGFTAGARFIMIKRTDSTGAWYVWDSARGIVAGNDSYILLNTGAAEVTNTDFVDPASVGFEISSTAPAEINASGGSFIFLAVA